MVNTYPTLGRQTDSMPKRSSLASHKIKYCAFLVKTVLSKTSEAAAVPVSCSTSWHSIVVERASRIYLVPPPGTQIIRKNKPETFLRYKSLTSPADEKSSRALWQAGKLPVMGDPDRSLTQPFISSAK